MPYVTHFSYFYGQIPSELPRGQSAISLVRKLVAFEAPFYWRKMNAQKIDRRTWVNGLGVVSGVAVSSYKTTRGKVHCEQNDFGV